MTSVIIYIKHNQNKENYDSGDIVFGSRIDIWDFVY